MTSILERLEKAEAPSRELDLEIERFSVGEEFFEQCAWVEDKSKELGGQYFHSEFGPIHPPQHFTSSFDSALTLYETDAESLAELETVMFDIFAMKGEGKYEPITKWRVLKAFLIRAVRAHQTGGEG